MCSLNGGSIGIERVGDVRLDSLFNTKEVIVTDWHDKQGEYYPQKANKKRKKQSKK